MADERTGIDAVASKISEILAQLRGKYLEAVHSSEDNTFSWRGDTFLVDQVRHLIVSAGQVGDRWTRHDGKVLILNRPVPVVDIYVGPGRFLTARDFLRTLEDIVMGHEQSYQEESALGLFLSLMVVEPHFNPLAEITTMLAVAHALAQGRESDNIFRLIPPTVTTEVDIATIPGFDPSEHARLSAEEIAQREIELIKTIRPNLLQEIDRLLVDHNRNEVIRMLKDELRDYVRTHVFARLAREAGASTPA